MANTVFATECCTLQCSQFLTVHCSVQPGQLSTVEVLKTRQGSPVDESRRSESPWIYGYIWKPTACLGANILNVYI